MFTQASGCWLSRCYLLHVLLHFLAQLWILWTSLALEYKYRGCKQMQLDEVYLAIHRFGFTSNYDHSWFVLSVWLWCSEGVNAKRGFMAVFHEVKILIRNEGFQSLSKGLSFFFTIQSRCDPLAFISGLLPRLCMAVPVATLESIFYEVTLSLFSKNRKRDWTLELDCWIIFWRKDSSRNWIRNHDRILCIWTALCFIHIGYYGELGCHWNAITSPWSWRLSGSTYFSFKWVNTSLSFRHLTRSPCEDLWCWSLLRAVSVNLLKRP